MNQAMKVSDTTLLDELDYDIVQEEKHKKAELNEAAREPARKQIAQAELQGEVLMVTTRYQIQAQKMMQEAGVPPPELRWRCWRWRWSTRWAT
jgi:hypothetical protein